MCLFPDGLPHKISERGPDCDGCIAVYPVGYAPLYSLHAQSPLQKENIPQTVTKIALDAHAQYKSSPLITFSPFLLFSFLKGLSQIKMKAPYQRAI